jgi:hypothetical protein
VSVATSAEFAALSPPRAEQTSGFAAQRPIKASVADADDAAIMPIAQAPNNGSRSIDVALCLPFALINVAAPARQRNFRCADPPICWPY